MSEDIKKLKEQLKDSDRSLRASAAEELADMDTPQAIEILINALKIEEDPIILELLIRLLGEVGARDAVPLIIDLLNTKEEDVQDQCIEALSDLADEENAVEIYMALDSLERSVEDFSMRNNIQTHIEHILPLLRTFIIESYTKIKELEEEIQKIKAADTVKKPAKTKK
jgi:HEAT repeat protein